MTSPSPSGRGTAEGEARRDEVRECSRALQIPASVSHRILAQRSSESAPLHYGSLACAPPLPASRGRVTQAIPFSRRTCVRVLPTKATKLLPPKNKGRRSADRRNCPVGPRHASDVATRMRFGRGRAFIGARSPLGAPPRRSLRPCAEARSRPRFTRCSAQALPTPWHRA